nr:putative reverse transcriptase domain-containing protein [Tanacetum cinerariifolium]
MEFEIGDRVMLKVSPWKGVVRFVMPLEGVHIDDTLQFVEEPGPEFTWECEDSFKKKYPPLFTNRTSSSTTRVHHTFHVSNLKKCYADEPLAMPLEGIHVDDRLQFMEEPVEIMEREIKQLKRSRIPLVKVCWNSRRGHVFTWERKDSFKKKYPHIFTNRVSSSTTRPYARRMITTPGEPDLHVPVPESFHEQTDEELTENDIKRMDADDQAIQTIILG